MARSPDDLAPPKKTSLAFIESLKRQWMAMIDALVDPVIFVRQDGVIDKANKAMAKWANRDIKEIIGKPCREIFKNIDIPCPTEMFAAAFQGIAEKHVLTHQTNDKRFFEVTAHPHQIDDGGQPGYVLVYRDQTEAHHLQEQLVQSEKLASIGLLAGGIAHELNNPLGGILVFSQMILREMSPESSHYQDVEEILHATERCKAIVDNLLEFARTRSANSHQNINDAVSVDDAIETALRFIKIGMATDSVDVNLYFNSDDATIWGDRNKVIQVFLNLMQNAMQAMPNGGSLTIRTERNEQNLTCTISDTGIGIPSEQLKRIFDPFFTTKDPGEGTGLGLAICYGIVQDLNGRIRVSSRLNVGTEFTIEFPIHHGTQKSA